MSDFNYLPRNGWAPGVLRASAFRRGKPGYLAAGPESGRIRKRHMGRHNFAMSMILVSDPLDSAGKIELEATAVVHD
jgi:hypothetical protein